MRLPIFLLALSSASIVFSLDPVPEEYANVPKEFFEKFQAAIKSGDPVAVVDLFAPDDMLPVSGMIEAAQGIIKSFESYPTGIIERVRYEYGVIQINVRYYPNTPLLSKKTTIFKIKYENKWKGWTMVHFSDWM